MSSQEANNTPPIPAAESQLRAFDTATGSFGVPTVDQLTLVNQTLGELTETGDGNFVDPSGNVLDAELVGQAKAKADPSVWQLSSNQREAAARTRHIRRIDQLKPDQAKAVRDYAQRTYTNPDEALKVYKQSVERKIALSDQLAQASAGPQQQARRGASDPSKSARAQVAKQHSDATKKLKNLVDFKGGNPSLPDGSQMPVSQASALLANYSKITKGLPERQAENEAHAADVAAKLAAAALSSTQQTAATPKPKTPHVSHKRDELRDADLVRLDRGGRARHANGKMMRAYELDLIEEHKDQILERLATRNQPGTDPASGTSMHTPNQATAAQPNTVTDWSSATPYASRNADIDAVQATTPEVVDADDLLTDRELFERELRADDSWRYDRKGRQLTPDAYERVIAKQMREFDALGGELSDEFDTRSEAMIAEPATDLTSKGIKGRLSRTWHRAGAWFTSSKQQTGNWLSDSENNGERATSRKVIATAVLGVTAVAAAILATRGFGGGVSTHDLAEHVAAKGSNKNGATSDLVTQLSKGAGSGHNNLLTPLPSGGNAGHNDLLTALPKPQHNPAQGGFDTVNLGRGTGNGLWSEEALRHPGASAQEIAARVHQDMIANHIANEDAAEHMSGVVKITR